jgi:hypothetical protein
MQCLRIFAITVVTLNVCAPAFAQSQATSTVRSVNLSGPRVGFTSLSQGVVDTLAERSIEVRPLITQFGWQFEKQFYSKGGGLTAVNEWVFLVGGLEQDVALPSLSWIIGLRTREGAEFGVGPNITPAGTALVFAAGVTFKSGALNLPVNVAVVPTKSGVRMSMLAGFNFRSR